MIEYIPTRTLLLILGYRCRCLYHHYLSFHVVNFNLLLQNFTCALRIPLVTCGSKFQRNSVTTYEEWLSDTKFVKLTPPPPLPPVHICVKYSLKIKLFSLSHIFHYKVLHSREFSRMSQNFLRVLEKKMLT